MSVGDTLPLSARDSTFDHVDLRGWFLGAS